jgi:hypothetical protein
MSRWNIGDVYRAMTGEILEVAPFPDDQFCFRVRHPVTLELQKNAIYGPLHALEAFAQKTQLEKIDISNYVPTGLVHD